MGIYVEDRQDGQGLTLLPRAAERYRAAVEGLGAVRDVTEARKQIRTLRENRCR
jgi:hypothetical protein